MRWVVKKGEEYLTKDNTWSSSKSEAYVYRYRSAALSDANYHFGRVVRLVPKRKLVSVPAGRAATHEAKWRIVLRIFNAWVKVPELRLGQLWVNATAPRANSNPFYIEDELVADYVEQFAAQYSK